MSRKDKKLPVYQNIEISDVAAEGKAIARIENMVIFLTGVVPGDVVDIQITRKKNSYMEGKAVLFHKYSELRTEPFCEHFGMCGGCKWQNLPYSEQLKFKEKQVYDQLERIGKIVPLEKNPILPSPKSQNYRNKLEFTFSRRRWLLESEMHTGLEDESGLGFHLSGMFNKVLDIKKCYLAEDIGNEIRNEVRIFAREHELEFYDINLKQGFLRNLIIRTTTTGELMVIVVFGYEHDRKQELLMGWLLQKYKEITSLMYIVNTKVNDSITDLVVLQYAGKEYMIETMNDLSFKIGPKSFYQPNPLQGHNLYKIVRNYCELIGNETVYDFYTGTGTIANFVAPYCRKVIGIEYVADAIEDAKINSEINNIKNTFFVAGDIKDILTEGFINQHGKPDIIITDPPRAGMHDHVIETILTQQPKKVVYVSCNPATQARDIQLLSVKYDVLKAQPVDMFPHTHHVENICLLQLKN